MQEGTERAGGVVKGAKVEGVGVGWWVSRGGLVRQGGRVDAWARVRPRKRDGDGGHA